LRSYVKHRCYCTTRFLRCSRLLESLLSLAGSTLPSKTSAVATVVPVARRHTPVSGVKAPAETVGPESADTTIADSTLTATAAAPTVAAVGASDTEDTPEEVVLLFRSRAAELLHYFVLLMHVVLTQLWLACGDEETQGEKDAGADRAERRLAIQQSVLEVSLVKLFL
jgi:hypothetical protein